MAGRCPLLGAIIWPKAEYGDLLQPATEDRGMRLQAELSLTDSDGFGMSPVSEVIAVRTQRDFGCVHHAKSIS
jgi:hypothetical protein